MTVQVYTAAWCRDCRAAKQFLDAHGITYVEINVDRASVQCRNW
jgi:glutaredoxin